MMPKLRKFLAATAFGALVLGAAGTGTVYGLMQRDTPIAIDTAQSLMRTLSQRWRFADIARDFQPMALKDLDTKSTQAALWSFRPLGGLVEVHDAALQHYALDFDRDDGIVRRVQLGFVARFENGEARITLTLVTAHGVTKVQHLGIKPLRMPQQNQRRSIA